MRFLYTLAFYLGLPFIFLRLYIRGRKSPDYRQAWAERLGYQSFSLDQSIWIHAVSFGESIAATPLIKHLQKAHPDMPIVVTTTTPTGRAHLRKAFGESIHLSYFPYDLPGILNRFLDKIKPKMLILIETELWPNLLHTCHNRKIKVVLANARLSERSAKQYARIKNCTAKMLQAISVIAAQNTEDGQRFINLGLPKDRLIITGSIKFDLSVSDEVKQKAQALKSQWNNRPVWIAASTHQGEDEKILEAFRLVLAKVPNALLILVPRHPERFEAVKQLCETEGFKLVSRSSSLPCEADTQIYLGDTMGEMLVLLGASDLAFIAGSFNLVGGHNLLEPAAMAVPSIIGPHYFNFKEITTMLFKADATYIVQTPQELATRVIELFNRPELAKERGQNGLNVLEQNRGALAKLCGIIDSLLG